MSQALSNLGIFLPLSSQKKASKPLKLQSFFKPIENGSLSHKKHKVMARAGETRDNLDHLQRVTKQPPPKKRTAPTPPIGNQFKPPTKKINKIFILSDFHKLNQIFYFYCFVAGLWDRFPTARTVQQMMETMERITDDPFDYSGEWPSPAGTFGRGRTPWEIKEGETEYKMRFDMPGMTKEDVRVWVEEKMLVVKAEKKEEQGGGGDKEWSAKSYGKYSCRISLPENVQLEKIKAEVKDGVLYITIPKASTTSKILDINVE